MASGSTPTAPSSATSASNSGRNVAIIGGGVIGICTAYYLLDSPNPPARVTLIEAYAVAGCASGKAGGFLALDWHGPATTSLAALSWRLHAELAREHDGVQKWGFRTMDSVSYTVHTTSTPATDASLLEPNPALEGSDMRPRPPPMDAEVDKSWLNKEGDTDVLGTPDSTGQVTPRQFAESLFQAAQGKGLRYVHGRPVRLSASSDGRLESIHVQLRDSNNADAGETAVLCSDLVIAAGPWSKQVLRTLNLPELPVGNLPGHSIIIQAPPSRPISATSVFSSIYGANRPGADTSGKTTESPEFFPRADGTVYVAGENNAKPIPEDPATVDSLMDVDIAEGLLRATRHVSSGLAAGEVVKRQLCYRPTLPDGKPVVGKLKDGVWIATGHGPWGITLCTGTGKIVSELVLDGQASSADIRELSPDRFALR